METWAFGLEIQFACYFNALHCIHSCSPFSPEDIKDSQDYNESSYHNSTADHLSKPAPQIIHFKCRAKVEYCGKVKGYIVSCAEFSSEFKVRQRYWILPNTYHTGHFHWLFDRSVSRMVLSGGVFEVIAQLILKWTCIFYLGSGLVLL